MIAGDLETTDLAPVLALRFRVASFWWIWLRLGRLSLAPPRYDSAAGDPSVRRVSLDPVRLRQELHRDSRGVQTILTWLTEGGVTANFQREVDRFIHEDGGDGPLIDGLIYVSVTLAHIAAGTIGTTAEALMASLVDMHVEADLTI